MILGAKELSRKDARAGHRAEHAQIEHKQQLVDDGNAGHGFRTHLTYHHIVKHTDKTGDDVLYQHRHHHRHKLSVKSFVSYVSVKHCLLKFLYTYHMLKLCYTVAQIAAQFFLIGLEGENGAVIIASALAGDPCDLH